MGGGELSDALRRVPCLRRLPFLTLRDRVVQSVTELGCAEAEYFDLGIEVERSALGLFISGQPHFETVISVHTDWVPTRINLNFGPDGVGQGVGQPGGGPCDPMNFSDARFADGGGCAGVAGGVDRRGASSPSRAPPGSPRAL